MMTAQGLAAAIRTELAKDLPPITTPTSVPPEVNASVVRNEFVRLLGVAFNIASRDRVILGPSPGGGVPPPHEDRMFAADGSRLQQTLEGTSPNMAIVFTRADEWAKRDLNGVQSMSQPDGTTTTVSTTGVFSTTRPDGEVIARFPDGTLFTVAVDGSAVSGSTQIGKTLAQYQQESVAAQQAAQAKARAAIETQARRLADAIVPYIQTNAVVQPGTFAAGGDAVTGAGALT